MALIVIYTGVLGSIFVRETGSLIGKNFYLLPSCGHTLLLHGALNASLIRRSIRCEKSRSWSNWKYLFFHSLIRSPFMQKISFPFTVCWVILSDITGKTWGGSTHGGRNWIWVSLASNQVNKQAKGPLGQHTNARKNIVNPLIIPEW